MDVDLATERGLGRGVRLARVDDVVPGDYVATVTLLWHGSERLARVGRRHVEGATLLTLAMTRTCVGVRCDDPAAPECHGGSCVVATCTEETPETCTTAMCDASRPCSSSITCVSASCSPSGLCIDAPDDTLCGAMQRCDPSAGGCQDRILGTNLGEPENGTATGSPRGTVSRTPSFSLTPYGELPALALRVDVATTCTGARPDACVLVSPATTIAPWNAADTARRFTLPTPLDVDVPPAQPVGRRYYFAAGVCPTADGSLCQLRQRYLDVGRLRDDLDGDGDSEVVVATSAGVIALLGDPAGLGTTPTVLAPGATGAALLGDASSDGFADVAVLGAGGDVTIHYGAATLGALATTTLPTTGTVLALATAGDVDADGDADLLLRVRDASGIEHVEVALAPFTSAPVVLEQPADAVQVGWSLACGDRAGSDGYPDPLVTWTTSTGARFYRTDVAVPGGPFVTGGAVPVSGTLVALVPDVVDGDGARDFVIADPSASGGSGHVDVISSIDARPYGQELTPPVPGAALGTSIAAGDATEAGRSVLAMGAPGADLVLWLDPTISEVPTPVQGPVGTHFGAALAFHDVDGDGRAELIVTADGEGALYVVEASGSGALGTTRVDVPGVGTALAP